MGNISGYRPTVQAIVTDSQGTLSKDNINVYLDGQEVRNFQYRRKQERQEAKKLELRRAIMGRG